MAAPALKSVKIASLADHPSAEAAVDTYLKPNISSASADSGYDSMSSRPSSSTPHFRSRPRMKSHPAPPGMDVIMHEPLSDPGVDYHALKVPFQDFLGADMDECGNVDGRSLTEYLYPEGE